MYKSQINLTWCGHFLLFFLSLFLHPPFKAYFVVRFGIVRFFVQIKKKGFFTPTFFRTTTLGELVFGNEDMRITGGFEQTDKKNKTVFLMPSENPTQINIYSVPNYESEHV